MSRAEKYALIVKRGKNRNPLSGAGKLAPSVKRWKVVKYASASSRLVLYLFLIGSGTKACSHFACFHQVDWQVSPPPSPLWFNTRWVVCFAYWFIATFVEQVTFSWWARAHSVGRWRSQILASVKWWTVVMTVWSSHPREQVPTGTSLLSVLLSERIRPKFPQRYVNNLVLSVFRSENPTAWQFSQNLCLLELSYTSKYGLTSANVRLR